MVHRIIRAGPNDARRNGAAKEMFCVATITHAAVPMHAANSTGRTTIKNGRKRCRFGVAVFAIGIPFCLEGDI
jgi:hypothetical protein